MTVNGTRFTGEYVVLGETPSRIEHDHLARYRYATRFVAGRTVLDAACGTGYGTRQLAEAGARHVVGVDLSDDALAIARAETKPDQRVSFVQCDATRPPLRRMFDVACSFETIEHVPDANAMLAALRGVLKPGGLLLVSSPNRPVTSPAATSMRDQPRNRYHVREFTPKELTTLLEMNGFAATAVLGQRLAVRVPTGTGRLSHLGPLERLRPGSPDLRPFRLRAPRYFVVVARLETPD